MGHAVWEGQGLLARRVCSEFNNAPVAQGSTVSGLKGRDRMEMIEGARIAKVKTSHNPLHHPVGHASGECMPFLYREGNERREMEGGKSVKPGRSYSVEGSINLHKRLMLAGYRRHASPKNHNPDLTGLCYFCEVGIVVVGDDLAVAHCGCLADKVAHDKADNKDPPKLCGRSSRLNDDGKTGLDATPAEPRRLRPAPPPALC